MNAILSFIKSSIGRKYLMAGTGCLLVAFLIIHMIGNWKWFLGADDINHYAHVLKYYTLVIWGFRAGLLGVAAIHVATAISLVYENYAARPVGYAVKQNNKANFASLTMAVSGGIVLIFIVFHILHFTVHAFNPEFNQMKAHISDPSGIFQAIAPVTKDEDIPDVYSMVKSAFSNPLITGFYIISMACICFHLCHGIRSSFQSLGITSPGVKCFQCFIAIFVALVIFLGMSAVPAVVLLWYK